MNARALKGLLALFACGAAMGAAFVVLGPVPFMRLLGLVALASGTVGCAVQAWALREFAPEAYVALCRTVRGALRSTGVAFDPAQAVTALP